jgi:hypothetical protein
MKKMVDLSIVFPLKMVDLSIVFPLKMVDFSIAMLNYQRVTYEIIFFWGNKDP